jgi:hypothetical protein
MLTVATTVEKSASFSSFYIFGDIIISSYDSKSLSFLFVENDESFLDLSCIDPFSFEFALYLSWLYVSVCL